MISSHSTASSIAVVVLHQRRAEHLHLRPVPAGDDVEREAAAGDVVDGGGLLGRHDRMHRQHVRGREHRRSGWCRRRCRPPRRSVSKPGPLKLVTPPKPFQRPTGTSASNSISSASFASVSVFGQLISSTPSMVEIAQPRSRLRAERAELELAVAVERIARRPQFVGSLVCGHAPSFRFVIPGRAEGANPESRCTRRASFWIPGSPLRGAPE